MNDIKDKSHKEKGKWRQDEEEKKGNKSQLYECWSVTSDHYYVKQYIYCVRSLLHIYQVIHTCTEKEKTGFQVDMDINRECEICISYSYL